MSYREPISRSRSSSPSAQYNPSPSGSRYPASPYEAGARAQGQSSGQRRSASPPHQPCIAPSPLSSLDRGLDDDGYNMDADISSVAASVGSEVREDPFPPPQWLPPAPVLTRERLTRHDIDPRPRYDPGAERTDLQPHNRTQWSPPFPAHMHPASRRPNTDRGRMRESDNSSIAASVGSSDPAERPDTDFRAPWPPHIPVDRPAPRPPTNQGADIAAQAPWRMGRTRRDDPAVPTTNPNLIHESGAYIFRMSRRPHFSAGPVPATEGSAVESTPPNIPSVGMIPSGGMIPSVGIVPGTREDGHMTSWMLAVHPRTDHMPSALHPRMEDRIGTRQNTLRPTGTHGHPPVVHMQMGPFGPVGIPPPTNTHRVALPRMTHAIGTTDQELINSMATIIGDMVDGPWDAPAFMFIPMPRPRDQLSPAKAAQLCKALANVTKDMMGDVEAELSKDQDEEEEDAGWKCGICLMGQDEIEPPVKGGEESDMVPELEGREENQDNEREGETGVKMTPCNHLFHGHCLLPWFERRSTCPLCRKPLESLLTQDVLDQLD